MTPVSTVESGVSVREEYGQEVTRQAETAMGALAAQQRALIEARFIMAMRRQRNWNDVRARINEYCLDPEFAAAALYVKPISQTPEGWAKMSKREQLLHAPESWPMGFSVRFVEAALFEAGNFDVDSIVIWEDDTKRMVRTHVTDLERNSSFARVDTIPKTIERKYLKKGQEPLGQRLNANNQVVYILEATPDDVKTMENAAVSKSIRTEGERLLPPQLKREWRALIENTVADQDAKDPQAAKKILFDSFAGLGVMPSDLEKWLRHAVESLVPAELQALRKVYVAISNAEITWAEVMAARDGSEKPPEKPPEKLRDRILKSEEPGLRPPHAEQLKESVEKLEGKK